MAQLCLYLPKICKIAAESLASTYHPYAAVVDAVLIIDNRIVQNQSVQVAQVQVGDAAYRAHAAIVVIAIVLAQSRALALVLAASAHAAGDLDV